MKIPGIYAIYYCNVEDFDIGNTDIIKNIHNSDKIITSAVWNIVDKVGFPTISEDMVVQNGQNVYSVDLSWFSLEPVMLSKKVFRIEDVNGRNFIIGTKDKPYAVFSRHFSEAGPTQKKGYECKVKYKNTHGLIEVIV